MNPFELLGKFDQIKAQAEKTMEGIDADWIVRAGACSLVRCVLNHAKVAGPPAGFGERLQMEPAQAKILYDAVLDAAITRK